MDTRFLTQARLGKLTPKQIQTAAKKGELDMTDPTTKKTALHISAEKNFTDTVKSLLKAGASVTLLDTEGNTALHLACRHLNYDVIKTILEFCPHDFNYLLENKSGKTILMEYRQERSQNETLAIALTYPLHQAVFEKLKVMAFEQIKTQHPNKIFTLNEHGQFEMFTDASKAFAVVKDKDFSMQKNSDFASGAPKLFTLFHSKESLVTETIDRRLQLTDLYHEIPFAAFPEKSPERKEMDVLGEILQKANPDWTTAFDNRLQCILASETLDKDFKTMIKNLEKEFIQVSKSQFQLR